MRKKTDFEVIAEQYSTKILNEAPYEAGDYADNPQKDKYGLQPGERETKWKAAVSPQYSKMTGDIGSNPHFEEIMSNIADAVGASLLQSIQDAGGQIPDNPSEVYTRVSEVIKNIKVGGRPLFMPSHTFHIARNVVQALIAAGMIKEIKNPRKPGAGRPSARPSGSDFNPSDLSFS